MERYSPTYAPTTGMTYPSYGMGYSPFFPPPAPWMQPGAFSPMMGGMAPPPAPSMTHTMPDGSTMAGPPMDGAAYGEGYGEPEMSRHDQRALRRDDRMAQRDYRQAMRAASMPPPAPPQYGPRMRTPGGGFGAPRQPSSEPSVYAHMRR